MSLLNAWLARITTRIDDVRDRVAVATTGRCRHRTHQEMLAARSYCPDCRRRYVAWAEGIGLGVDPSGRDSEWKESK